MPKPRSKRQAIRDERKQKRHDAEEEVEESANKRSKRQRIDEDGNANNVADEYAEYTGSADMQGISGDARPEKEFFGMLSDQEQEYFRSVDEQLDVDDFPSQDERDMYLANVFAEAQGKELKLACSQSCSRLMERLILMSNTRQKKKLFDQFASHFLNLIQHRFASHCCETLFLQSAPVVSRELSGERDDEPAEGEEEDAGPLPTMEELFLLTLDELEGQLGYLLTDRFASHSLRVLLIVLSGRPLDQAATKSLVHSKKKEKISAPWKSGAGSEEKKDALRPVPSSFTAATKKIIADSTEGMDATALRLLARHPTGNPILQLLLELDIAVNSKKDTKKGETEPEEDSSERRLLWQLLPLAPASLKEEQSMANEFINSMLYDPIGSRLLETLVSHCPGKLFKVMFKHNFADRIQSLARNDVASYPAIRILNRLGKEDLAAAVEKIAPEMPKLVSLSRFNVIKALFERCNIRDAKSEVGTLLRALTSACGGDKKTLIPKLCIPEKEEDTKKSGQQSLSKNQSAIISHGCHLATTMLSIRGATSNAIQTSLVSLSPELIMGLATSSGPTMHVLTTAFATPSDNKAFHKVLVAALMKDIMGLAVSDHGSKVISAIVSVPSKSEGINLPFHMKQQIMDVLGEHEMELRDSFQGRKVWKAWQGDMWKTRPRDWIAWTKEVDTETRAAAPVWKRQQAGGKITKNNPNMVKVDEAARRKRADVETTS
ncbi:pumilio-family RNA binding repeat domain-containing protein [Truncatella angustata]|uniref:Nucleolar protein 9 n=1 Tax=Truncatella angustata TaxID=152316 RepID=A0A9P8ZUV0_9PEZI|nr:pumilio-family RNA binding repeat domain-containing protein [Truncatella angustata]KAH6652019.1 pumilio-family RNA binding repeat domain-containing protein [Truncatella angustata]KAH8195213.1 hypothetical protein TruAng_010631 [Truncatella angustata]